MGVVEAGTGCLMISNEEPRPAVSCQLTGFRAGLWRRWRCAGEEAGAGGRGGATVRATEEGQDAQHECRCRDPQLLP